MSRIILTEKGVNFAKLQALSLENIDKSVLLPRSRTNSIKKKVKAALEITTSKDSFNEKSRILFNASRNFDSMQIYLEKLSVGKSKFLEKKIEHLTKLMKNDYIQKSIPINETLNLSINNEKKSTKILYSENYIERLMARYNKYLLKNKEIQCDINEKIDKHWRTVNQRKREMPVSYTELKNNLKDKENELRETNYRNREKERIGKVHKHRYMSLWEINKLPIKGIGYPLRDSL